MNCRQKIAGFFIKEVCLPLRELLFPRICSGCGRVLSGRQAITFCQTCQGDIRIIKEPYCLFCGKPFAKSAGKSHLCSYCLTHTWYFEKARGVMEYRGPIADAVKSFKYNGEMYVLETFAVLAEHYYRHHRKPEPDMILPVPLHPERLRKRGFNQALVLSRKLFPLKRDIINPFVLERYRSTKPQTGLSVAGRRGNVRNAFRVNNPRLIQDKKILLVDDVFTTGATVNECARILKKNKAAGVEVLTFARVADHER